jgi:hypothetical protein
MYVEILSKALELAADLAYLTALWLLRRDRRLADEGDGVLMIEGPKPQTTVVFVRFEDETDDVIIWIGVTR